MQRETNINKRNEYYKYKFMNSYFWNELMPYLAYLFTELVIHLVQILAFVPLHNSN